MLYELHFLLFDLLHYFATPADLDFQVDGQNLTLTSSISRLCFNVSAVADTRVENPEILTISLRTVDPTVLFQNSIVNLTILDQSIGKFVCYVCTRFSFSLI